MYKGDKKYYPERRVCKVFESVTSNALLFHQLALGLAFLWCKFWGSCWVYARLFGSQDVGIGNTK